MKTKIADKFNDTADGIGCRARIGIYGKKLKFFEFRGSYLKGFEVWLPIDSQRFVGLTAGYV